MTQIPEDGEYMPTMVIANFENLSLGASYESDDHDDGRTYYQLRVKVGNLALAFAFQSRDDALLFLGAFTQVVASDKEGF